jgi:hypothetical protein
MAMGGMSCWRGINRPTSAPQRQYTIDEFAHVCVPAVECLPSKLGPETHGSLCAMLVVILVAGAMPPVCPCSNMFVALYVYKNCGL